MNILVYTFLGILFLAKFFVKKKIQDTIMPNVPNVPTPDEPKPNGIVALPNIPIISFQYYNTQTVEKPSMSVELYNLLVGFHLLYYDKYTGKGYHMHFVHVGTIGDEKHEAWSFHKRNPPDAIDVTKIYLDDRLIYIPRDKLSDRELIRQRIESLGGKCCHVTDASLHHIHIQTRV